MKHTANGCTELLNRTVYNSGYVCKVVGVIKDFRIGNFTNPQAPFILMSTKNFGNCVHVRLKEPFAENLQKLNKVSADAFPDKTVDFRSMEQMIKESYNSIRVFSNATILAAVTMFFVMMKSAAVPKRLPYVKSMVPKPPAFWKCW